MRVRYDSFFNDARINNFVSSEVFASDKKRYEFCKKLAKKINEYAKEQGWITE